MKNVKYQIAISLAGEDRGIADHINGELKKNGISTFYDSDFIAHLWGKNLAEELQKIYSTESQFCLMLVSKHYLHKIWTTHERRAAISRMLRQREEYLLIYFLDETAIEQMSGISPDTAYLRYDTHDFSTVVNSLIDKVNQLRALKYEEEEKPALVLIDSGRWGGTLTRITDRGFGFINYNVIRNDLFFHSNELVGTQFNEMSEGDEVTFQIAASSKGWVAVNVARA